MADSAQVHEAIVLASPPTDRLLLETVHAWITTVDHKKIGLMYIGYALAFLIVAGLEAVVIRLQLAVPQNNLVSPQVFNRLFTMHGTTMVFFVGMPILFGFGNYLIPLMLGARDMAFPRLNAFSFWISAFGGVLLYFSFLGGDGYGNALNPSETIALVRFLLTLRGQGLPPAVDASRRLTPAGGLYPPGRQR